MNSSQPLEWHRLFNAALNNQLNEQDKAQMTALLKSNAEARQLWFLYSDLECSLPEQKLPTLAETRDGKRSFFSWVPLTAAAAGVMVGLFGATVAFAYALPKPIQLALHLENPTFEAPRTPLFSEPTAGFGFWWGAGEIVSAQSKVNPAEGKQMVQFHPSELRPASWGAFTSSAKVSQVIDLREWRDQLRDGNATALWSAKFNSGPQRDPRKTTFRVDLRAYSGELTLLEKPWIEREDQELAHSLSRTIDDDDPSTWQASSGKIILPPDSDFLLVELKLFQADRSGDQINMPQNQQFVDDIQFSIHTDPSLAQTPSNP